MKSNTAAEYFTGRNMIIDWSGQANPNFTLGKEEEHAK